MIINRIEINNIGIIQHLEIKEAKGNIIILQGCNGCGKTTALAAIYSLFIDKNLFYLDPNMSKTSSEDSFVEMRFTANQSTFVLRRSFELGKMNFHLSCNKPFKDIGAFNFDKIYYYNSERLNHNFTFKQLDRISKFMKDYDFEFENISNIHLPAKYLSGGQLSIINLINFLSLVPKDSIVLADSILYTLDFDSINKILDLFKKLDYIKFIIAFTPHIKFSENLPVYEMRDNSEYISPLQVNYGNLFHSDLEIMEDKTEQAIQLAIYKLDEFVNEEENFEIEFKSINGNNPCKSILSVADQYIVSFLNSPHSNEGIIRWGITDDGKVVGVKLNKKQRDEIRKEIQSQINNILPPLTSDICDLRFQVILDDKNNIINDLYIVELKIRHKFSKNLYSTGKGEVFIKKDGVKQKLNPYQIQLEAVQRNK